MVSQIMPYVDRATSLVPNFGKGNALLFTAGLLAETVLRYGVAQPGYTELDVIQCCKCFQSAMALIDLGPFSVIRKIGTIFITFAFQFPIVHDRFSTTFRVAELKYDRPRLISFVQVTGEAINIASKVIGSLATGIVVQRMATGGATGKIRVVVSAALLALSAYNVFNNREFTKNKIII